MFGSLVRRFFQAGRADRNDASRASACGPLHLHIGGETRHPDWKILNVRSGPHVDFIGHCSDLSPFDDASVAEIYASHVVEHLGYKRELPSALNEFNRVLVRGGTLRISVPDLAVLCRLYVDPAMSLEDRYQVMRMMFGGQLNAADFHYAGFDEEALTNRLKSAGFVEIVRVPRFEYFDDSSNYAFRGHPVCLNLCARKSAAE
jgi:predicted SAM-dependent methyltransferase